MSMQQRTKILLIGAALGGVAVWVYLKNKRRKQYRDTERIVGTDITYLYPAPIYPMPYPYFGNVMYPPKHTPKVTK